MAKWVGPGAAAQRAKVSHILVLACQPKVFWRPFSNFRRSTTNPSVSTMNSLPGGFKSQLFFRGNFPNFAQL
jgi:hypothetical protein